jgi:malonyl-CoA O-methyltransferase
MTLKTEICNSFNHHAFEYEQAARVQKEIGERLFARLDYLKMAPRYVLDLGCGPGFILTQLKKRYPKACVVGLDLAMMMLKEADGKRRIFKKSTLVQADMVSMPFAAGVFDLVFANQVVHWSMPMSVLMREVNRVMNVDGCFMFSTLGPDTFQELRKAWAGVHQYAHTNDFADMHDLGDQLLSERFVDPVVDMEHLTVHYATLPELLSALKAQGVRNINTKRNRGLTGRHAFRTFEAGMKSFCTDTGKFPLTYEVVYGQAWKGATHLGQSGSETFIPVASLRGSRKIG